MPNLHEDDEIDLDDDLDEEEEAPQPRKQAKARTQPKRERRESREATANAEAQQRGQEAYANGDPRSANPYEPYSSTKSCWMYGWGLAWFAATGATGMPVYSHLPSVFCPPAEAQATYQDVAKLPGFRCNFESRDTAPALPWALDQLPGSRWLNIHTGREATIGPIGIDRWGQPVAPYANDPFSHTAADPRSQYVITLGIWTSDRYVIEHWLRCDHWEPEQRVVWFGGQLAHIRHSRNDREGRRTAERAALAEQQRFADQHSLVLTTEQINAGRGQRTDGKPEQLNLF